MTKIQHDQQKHHNFVNAVNFLPAKKIDSSKLHPRRYRFKNKMSYRQSHQNEAQPQKTATLVPNTQVTKTPENQNLRHFETNQGKTPSYCKRKGNLPPRMAIRKLEKTGADSVMLVCNSFPNSRVRFENS